MPRYLQYLAVALALLPSAAAAVELGNKERGLAYAQQVCADCHAVEKDTSYLFTDIPSFQEIADTQGMSPRALAVWLQTSHPNMPDLIIPPDDMDNVIAYIMSLRTPKE
jgi:mono/diheme cytochrome c family protein